MKIFSNFDTELSKRLLKEAKEKYGDPYALCVRRAKVYVLVRLFPPIVLYIFLSSCLFRLYYGRIGTKTSISDETGFVVWGLVLAMTIYLAFYTTKKLMNYYMDFVIITPDQLVSYDQAGILKRTTRSLELRKIKTINVVTDGWLSTFFGYGSIVFLAEGDVQNGDIQLNFILKPAQLRKTIYLLIEHRASMVEQDKTLHAIHIEQDGDDEYA